MAHASVQLYDLDCSGGMMEKIQQLIAPPFSEEGAKLERKRKAAEREMWRKRCNHETCDACGEGGDLLCCDRCPAAFHLQCCNPPLDEDKVPDGDWACHRCAVVNHVENSDKRHKHTLTQAALNLLKQHHEKYGCLPKPLNDSRKNKGFANLRRPVPEYSAPVSATAAASHHAPLERRLLPTSSNSAFSVPGSRRRPNQSGPAPNPAGAKTAIAASSDNSRKSFDASASRTEKDWRKNVIKATTRGQKAILEGEADHKKPGLTLDNPFALLIAASSLENTSLFELPPEYMINTPLPGTKKRRYGERSKGKKSSFHELDSNGLVPLPAKLCFICTRSCKSALLIQCDYCPLTFHADCLDPPLTNPPSGRWMCPNHAERKLLDPRGVVLSRRNSVYDLFTSRIDHHDVKINFLKKVHSTYPPKPPPTTRRPTTKVPQSIKDHYRLRPAPPPPPPTPAEEAARLLWSSASARSSTFADCDVTEPTASESGAVCDAGAAKRSRVGCAAICASSPHPTSSPPCSSLPSSSRCQGSTGNTRGLSSPEEQQLWLQSIVRLHADIALALEKMRLAASEHGDAGEPKSSEKTSGPEPLTRLASRACPKLTETFRSHRETQQPGLSKRSWSVSDATASSHAEEKSTGANGRLRVLSSDLDRPNFFRLPPKRRNSDSGIGSDPKRARLSSDHVTIYKPLLLPETKTPFSKLSLKTPGAVANGLYPCNQEAPPAVSATLPRSPQEKQPSLEHLAPEQVDSQRRNGVLGERMVPSGPRRDEDVINAGSPMTCSSAFSDVGAREEFRSSWNKPNGPSIRNLAALLLKRSESTPDGHRSLLSALDHRLITTLALQRLGQLFPPGSKAVDDSSSKTTSLFDSPAKLHSEGPEQATLAFSTYGPSRSAVHARLGAPNGVVGVIGPAKAVSDQGCPEPGRNTRPVGADLAADAKPAEKRQLLPAKSVFLHAKSGKRAKMFYRSFSIGTSADCDLTLTGYQHCNSNRALHAYAFFDEMAQQYELLCYGDTYVDGVKYGHNVERRGEKHRARCRQKMRPLTRAIKQMLRRKSNFVTRRQRRLQQAPATGDSPPPVRNVPPEGEVPEAQPTCDCDDDDSDLVCGWEGTAVLRHASVIKFGCVEFIFCMPEFAARQSESNSANDSERSRRWHVTLAKLRAAEAAAAEEEEVKDVYAFGDDADDVRTFGRDARPKRACRSKREETESKKKSAGPRAKKRSEEGGARSREEESLLKATTSAPQGDAAEPGRTSPFENREKRGSALQGVSESELTSPADDVTGSCSEEEASSLETGSNTPDDMKPIRFSQRQKERLARRKEWRRDDDHEEATLRAKNSKGRPTARSCSPVTSSGVIEAAMARKSDANEFFGPRVAKVREAKARKKQSSPLAREHSPWTPRAPKRKVLKATQQDEKRDGPSLVFSMAPLSETQNLALRGVVHSDSDGPDSRPSSRAAGRVASIDLTCSEILSDDLSPVADFPPPAVTIERAPFVMDVVASVVEDLIVEAERKVATEEAVMSLVVMANRSVVDDRRESGEGQPETLPITGRDNGSSYSAELTKDETATACTSANDVSGIDVTTADVSSIDVTAADETSRDTNADKVLDSDASANVDEPLCEQRAMTSQNDVSNDVSADAPDFAHKVVTPGCPPEPT